MAGLSKVAGPRAPVAAVEFGERDGWDLPKVFVQGTVPLHYPLGRTGFQPVIYLVAEREGGETVEDGLVFGEAHVPDSWPRSRFQADLQRHH